MTAQDITLMATELAIGHLICSDCEKTANRPTVRHAGSKANSIF